MADVFDQIKTHLREQNKDPNQPNSLLRKLNEDLEKEPGITTVDLLKLPREEKQILLFLMRDSEASLSGITEAELKSEFPEITDQVNPILEKLVRNGWLITLGEGSHIRYRIHMRRKPGSTLGFGIWSALSERLTR